MRKQEVSKVVEDDEFEYYDEEDDNWKAKLYNINLMMIK